MGMPDQRLIFVNPDQISSSTPRATRGIYTETSNKPLVTTPTPEQIVRLSKIPKVEYVSVLGSSPVFRPEGVVPTIDPVILGHSDNLWDVLVGLVERRFGSINRDEALASDVLDSAFNGNVCIRSTACSLNESFSFSSRGNALPPFRSYTSDVTVHVASIEELMEGKTEHGTWANVEPVNLRDPHRVYPLGKFPGKYLGVHAAEIRKALSKDGNESKAEAVFPVMIVYDLAVCRGNFGDNYHVELPETSENARQVVLGAYVLDMHHITA